MERRRRDEPHQLQGFTLIELSIVLVIIGLLVGGILVGMALIKAAQIRAEISEFDRYSTAANTFKLKFNALPGDMVNATTFFTATLPTTNANGNGDGYVNPQRANQNMDFAGRHEGGLFFVHLYLAGLSKFQPDHTPAHDQSESTIPPSHVRGRFGLYAQIYSGTAGRGVITADNRHHFITAVIPKTMDANSSDGRSAAWNASDAMSTDSKMDDGMPATGKVQVGCDDGIHNNQAYEPIPGQWCRVSTTSAPCVTVSGTYNVINDPADCGLKVQADF